MVFRVMTGLVLALVSLSSYAGDRVFDQSLKMQGEKTIVIDAGVGQLDIKASDDEQLHLYIKVEPDNGLTAPSEEQMAKIQMIVDRSSRRIKVSLDLPKGMGSDDVQEHWQVQIPAQLETEIDLGVGQLDVSGLAGGLVASVGVGEANLDIVSGDADVTVGVGEVDLTVRQADVGRVRLDTTVGDARLRVNGERVEGSSHFGIGQLIKYKGEGKDDVDVGVKVGEIRVELESAKD